MFHDSRELKKELSQITCFYEENEQKSQSQRIFSIHKREAT